MSVAIDRAVVDEVLRDAVGCGVVPNAAVRHQEVHDRREDQRDRTGEIQRLA